MLKTKINNTASFRISFFFPPLLFYLSHTLIYPYDHNQLHQQNGIVITESEAKLAINPGMQYLMPSSTVHVTLND
jgi:hypothetical protein